MEQKVVGPCCPTSTAIGQGIFPCFATSIYEVSPCSFSFSYPSLNSQTTEQVGIYIKELR
jgi:hypothetical protein